MSTTNHVGEVAPMNVSSTATAAAMDVPNMVVPASAGCAARVGSSFDGCSEQHGRREWHVGGRMIYSRRMYRRSGLCAKMAFRRHSPSSVSPAAVSAVRRMCLITQPRHSDS